MAEITEIRRMDEEERIEVCGRLEWEGGLEYFIHGSTFPYIKDLHFHTLREVFVQAAKELDAYIRYEDYLNVEDESEG